MQVYSWIHSFIALNTSRYSVEVLCANCNDNIGVLSLEYYGKVCRIIWMLHLVIPDEKCNMSENFVVVERSDRSVYYLLFYNCWHSKTIVPSVWIDDALCSRTFVSSSRLCLVLCAGCAALFSDFSTTRWMTTMCCLECYISEHIFIDLNPVWKHVGIVSFCIV